MNDEFSATMNNEAFTVTEDEPSTNELLDEYSLHDTQVEPDPGSELLVDGMPLEELAESEAPSDDSLD